MAAPGTPLSILNPRPLRLPGPSLLHQLVRQRSRDGHTPAIDYLAPDGRRTTWSYEQLHWSSDALAAAIVARRPDGEQASFIIPVLLPQCPELYISLLAILKAGGAFCPLNLDAPPDRISFILQDISAELVLTTRELAPRLATNEGITVLVVDGQQHLQQEGATRTTAAPRAPPTPDNLAYVMYTSGSTGTPKGVGISHGAATQSLLAHERHIPVFARFLQFAAPTFDVSVFEIFFPLVRGATLVCCGRAEMLDDLPAVLGKMEVDACELTPTVAGGLLRTRENAPGLRLLLTIGEMLTQPVIHKFGDSATQRGILWAMYGPTEATIHCTLQPAFESDSSVGNIGTPLDTVSAYVIEVSDSPGTAQPRVLPLGEAGELAVGGFQLASGYINRPEQTAAAFVDTQYGRLYRTGDRARIRPDGVLECLGRISDGQVKLRGQRIELGEVEQAILRTKGCHGAVASVVAGILVVFCAVDGSPGMAEAVLESCRSWLPRSMVPGDVVTMAEFPRLPSGKVDRKRLSNDYATSWRSGAEGEPAIQETPLSRQLRETAEQVLGSPVRATALLSASGMDSLQSIRYASSLQRLGMRVSAIDILDSRTLSDLHALVSSRSKDGVLSMDDAYANQRLLDLDLDDVPAAFPIADASSIEAVVECTPLQVSMLSETASNSRAYCNWIELAFSEGCTVDQVRSSLGRLAQANETFRTGFSYYNGRFIQVIWQTLQGSQIVAVEEFDLHFRLDTDESLLRPFHVQIRGSNTAKIRALIQIHHALYDGWSVDLMLIDLDAMLRGNDLLARPQFRQLVAHRISASESQAAAASQFWAETLLGFQPSATPELLATAARRGEQQTGITEEALGIDPHRVKRLAHDLDIGVPVIFQAALIWLWTRLAGQEDVVIGTVASGRTVPVRGVEEIMGPCLETVPLRTNIGQVRAIVELLETIHAANRALLAHSSLPLAEIKKAAGILPGNALYDILFVYQESLYSRQKDQRLVNEVAHRDFLETKLLFEIEPTGGDFTCRLTYHVDFWTRSQAETFINEFRCVLTHILDGSHKDVTSIRRCFPPTLLSQHNIQPLSFADRAGLAELVRRSATEFPERTAICFANSISDGGLETETVTYRELDMMGNRIARFLRSHGSPEGGVVAIVMEKSVLLYAGILGALKAGCAYLPLLPTTPEARVSTILEQARVALCLVDTDSKRNLEHHIPDCSMLDLQTAALDQYPGSRLDIGHGDGSKIANIIYTSGSTGTPKGVCVTHHNIASNLDVLSRIYPVKDKPRLLQSCSQAFDVSVFEIFFAWTRGMCLCSAVNDVLFEDLERAIRMLEITHLSMTPTVAAIVSPASVPTVEFLVTSGEPMTEKVAEAWVDQLYQGYGPSETTNICTVKKMAPRATIRHLGHAFANTSSFVMYPDSLESVPLGGVGELCFGGDQVVHGYLNMPELTAERFVTHPEHGRLYRSGDMGRMLPDGSLIIIGRIDDQIKVRGLRIELGEINSIVQHCDLASASITLPVHPRDSTSQQLATFYVPARLESGQMFHLLIPSNSEFENQSCSASLFQLLKSKLPSYMVPAYLIPISAIPLSPSGKVDRGRLRAAFAELSRHQLSLVSDQAGPPEDDHSKWTEAERVVAATVAETLGVEPSSVGLWTPFTSLGLDSISAIRAAKLLLHKFQRRIPLSVILQKACVAQLAPVLDEPPPEEDGPIHRLEVFTPAFYSETRRQCESRNLDLETILPCTPLQEAMLASPAQEGGGAYVNKMLFRLRTTPEKMQSVCQTMCQRHGILRTFFVTTDSANFSIAQAILRDHTIAWSRLSAQNCSVESCVEDQAQALPLPINSFQPPVSFAIIDKDLQPAPSYAPFLEQALSLPPTVDEFWGEHLGGFRPTLLQMKSKSGALDHKQQTFTKTLEISLSELQKHSKVLGISLLNICQASWACVLSSALKSRDVCFGNVYNGRSALVDGIDELVAPCFNTIPLRVSLDGIKRGIDLMKTLQGLNPELLKYQFTPLRRIHKRLDLDGNHVFNTLLLLQQPVQPLDDEVWMLEKDEGEMDFPLVCEVVPDPSNDNLRVLLHHHNDYLSVSDISTIFDLLSYVCRTMLRFPSSHLPVRDGLPDELQDRLGKLELQLHTPVGRMPASQEEVAELGWSEAESIIRSVFARLSSTTERDISHDTTIYQLGLDSISAVQVASLLRKRGIEVSAMGVIEHPSCRELARLAGKEKTSLVAILYDLAAFQRDVQPQLAGRLQQLPTVIPGSILPCTPLQCGMLSEFLHSNGKSYFSFIDWCLDDPANAEDLRKAWGAVIDASPMLRTGLVPVDHKDTSFAMIQYREQGTRPQVCLVKDDGPTKFNLDKWRLDAARNALDDLSSPPWRVAITERHDRAVTMHMAIHHALYDATSLRRALDNVERQLRSQQPLTPVLPMDDAVCDIWTRVLASSVAGAASFWQEMASRVVINRFPVMTPLRVDQAAIKVESTACSMPFGAIEAAARKLGFSVQSVLAAAWTRILSAYLGETSVVFGTVLSGRNTEATANTGLPCITTLPVIAENVPSNRQLVEQLMAFNTAIHKYEHAPLSQIRKWLGRADSHLFDTLLVYQKFDDDNETPDGDPHPWTVLADQGTVEFPVSLEVEPCGGVLRFSLTFKDSVLPPDQACLLLRQFEAVFCHLLLHPAESEDDLFRHSPRLFAVTPAEEGELPAEESLLHEFVEFRARKHPNKTALRFVTSIDGQRAEYRDWTYAELDLNGARAAEIIAAYTTPGDIVAIYFDKCPEAYFAILGVLKSGCSFVALDPGAPPSRKQFIIQDSGAMLLLTDKTQPEVLDFAVEVPVVIVTEGSLAQITNPVQDKVSPTISPSDTCYCLYTSGTTGTPKGCEITHENAVQAMLAFQKLFLGHWDEESRWLQFASLHFDVSVLEQYWTWSVGITLVAAPRELILEDVAGTISTLGITHIDLTPSLARLLHPDEVPSLCKGVFITGGEQLKQEILDVWGPTRAIHNFYGPTEATIGVTTFPRVPQNGRSSNIGRQFINVGSFVFRPGTEIPVLRGAVGELCVSGKLVGKGYLHREDLTRERFPTLRQFNNERVYRTGDLVRILHDGCFDFLGRADDQVKLRGQRLETAEINHVIKTGIPDVIDVATLVIHNDKLQKDVLASFVVSDCSGGGGSHSDPDSGGAAVASISIRVQEACRAKLPGYMVPTYVVRVPAIPLSANNKAETRTLKKLFNDLTQAQLLAATGSVGPNGSDSVVSTETGKRLFSAFRGMGILLDERQNVLPDTTIFDIGIDSISVFRLSRALIQEGLRATPALILQHPVISHLLGAIEKAQAPESSRSVLDARLLVDACQHRHAALACSALGVTPEQVEYIAPCSALQEGMISRSRSQESKDAYFNTIRLQLEHDTDVSRLRWAWQKAVDACAILRTRFVPTGEGFVQVALRTTSLPWSETRLADEVDVAEELVQKRRQCWVAANEDVIVEPFQLLLGSRSDGGRILQVNVFHALYDAISLDLLLDQVAKAYYGNRWDESCPSFMQALIHGPLSSYSHSEGFWVAQLQDISTEPLPKLAVSPAHGDIAVKRSISFTKLETIRKSMGVTHSAIVQALWTSIVQRLYCSSRVTIGLIVSGRSIELANAEQVVGPLFNTLPFHLKNIPGGHTWESLIKACHDFNTSVLSFQQVPLREVQKWCSAGKPLFDVLLSFHIQAAPGDGTPRPWRETEGQAKANYPLALEATLTENGILQLLLVAQGGIANEEVLAQLLDDFEAAASSAVDDLRGQILPTNHAETVGTLLLDLLPPESAASSSDPTGSRFAWTTETASIRTEMALLAGLGPDSIDENTSLLGLGLDSIDTIKLSSRLKSHGVFLTTGQLVKGQTIARFSDMLRRAAGGDNRTSVTPPAYLGAVSTALRAQLILDSIDLTNVAAVFPPTPLQESMVADMIQSDFRRYFNHDVLEIAPTVDISRLKSAWVAVIEHSPILRAGYIAVDNPAIDATFCQVIRDRSETSFQDVELDSAGDISGVIENARTLAKRGGGQSDLFQLSFARIHGRHYLVVSIAHALYDGWSLGLMHQDVIAAYSGEYSPRPSFENHLGYILQSSGQEEAETFWSGFLSGAAPTHLRQRYSLGSSEKKSVIRSDAASSHSVVALQSFCRRHAVSLQVLGQACWAAVLSSLADSLDVTFGVVLSGRPSEEAESLMYPTMNTVAVRAILHGTVSSLLRYMQDNMANASQFQHYPLRKAQRTAMATAASHPGAGLFNTLFMLQHSSPLARENTKTAGEPIMRSIDGGFSDVEYPVCLEMEVVDNSLVWRTACDSAYVSAAGASQLLHQLDVVLGFMMNDTQRRVLDFDTGGVSVCGLPAFDLSLANNVVAAPSYEVENELGGCWSPTEEAIRLALSQVSSVPESSISKSHSLFNIGLDSISAIKVASMLKKRGITLSVRAMLGSSSIGEMASSAAMAHPKVSESTEDSEAVLRQALVDVDSESLSRQAGIDVSDIESILPATAMQAHMVSAWQNSGGRLFFPAFRYRLRGPQLEAATVRSAWSKVVEEFPILRTRLVSTGLNTLPFVQVITKPNGNDGAGSKGTRDKPLVIFSLEDVGQHCMIVTVKIHHALYDGVSLPLIMGRFAQLCQDDGVQKTDRRPMENSAVLVESWKALIARRVSENTKTARRDFWTKYLKDISPPPRRHPLEPSTPVSPSRRHVISEFRPSAVADISRLRAAAARHGLSVQSLFFAAYAGVLRRSQQQQQQPPPHSPDVVFGIYLANRTASDESLLRLPGHQHQRLPYPTLSLVPLAVRGVSSRANREDDDDDSLVATARAIQRHLLDISTPENASAGLWEIREWTAGRVQVDSFVNFLSPPGGGLATSREVADQNAAVIMEQDGEDKNDDAGVDADVEKPESYAAFRNNAVRDAFPDAVDVEVAIHDGAMDIGVFGTEVSLGHSSAAGLLLSSIVDVLGTI